MRQKNEKASARDILRWIASGTVIGAGAAFTGLTLGAGAPLLAATSLGVTVLNPEWYYE